MDPLGHWLVVEQRSPQRPPTHTPLAQLPSLPHEAP